ncbi:MAG: nucleoside phosphorylase [Candidatus Dormibacteria bacterium]
MKEYHIQLAKGDVGRYVLLPGDPARSALIAEYFDSPHQAASNREFTTYTGALDGVPVSVCSTGIGSASTAIAVEELLKCGADTFIRVGTCGGLDPTLRRGELIVMQAAVRAEGTSKQYVPVEFPAVADTLVTTMLERACRETTSRYRIGITVSVDSFYSEIRPETIPIAQEMEDAYEAWKRSGVIAAEMECGVLFPLAHIRGARAGALCVIVDEAEDETMPEQELLPVDRLLVTVTKALRNLISYDSAKEHSSLLSYRVPEGM